MEMSVGKIVGQMGEGEWGQVHNFGDLVVVISFAGGAEAGREALTRIRELQHDGGLEKAVRTVEEEFGAEIGAVMVDAAKVYVAGNLKTWVRRAGGRQGSLAIEKALVSNIEDGLTIVMGNGRFWGCVPEGMVRTMTDAEELGAVVHGGERGQGAVGAIIKFETLNPKHEILNKSQVLMNNNEKREGWWKKIKMPKVGYQVPRTPKIKPIWAGVGFLILAATVFGGGTIWKKNIERKQSGIDEKIETIKQKFDEAKGVTELNPVRSRELLDEVQNGINELKGIKGLENIEKEIGTVREEAMGVKRPAAEELIDLGLVRDDMAGQKMVMGGGSLWVMGSEGRVVEVDLKSGDGKVTAQVEGGRLIAYYPEKTYVLGNKGIGQIPTDKDWSDIKDMEVWAGNIYLLDTDQVWVYRTTVKKDAWLDEKQELGSNMTIDGNVWILDMRNEIGDRILKFTRGVRQDFGVTGADDLRGDVIHTDDNAENLYVLDREGGKIVRIKKTGEYAGQYILDQAKEATDIIADEVNKKLYLLSGSKIYEVAL